LPGIQWPYALPTVPDADPAVEVPAFVSLDVPSLEPVVPKVVGEVAEPFVSLALASGPVWANAEPAITRPIAAASRVIVCVIPLLPSPRGFPRDQRQRRCFV
jgi:hypothetical protein